MSFGDRSDQLEKRKSGNLEESDRSWLLGWKRSSLEFGNLEESDRI
ncbi:MAG: hypothetical protein ACO3NK_17855 [Prochlorotrichaceae cyanobacterium]|jgi:hypothetical protein